MRKVFGLNWLSGVALAVMIGVNGAVPAPAYAQVATDPAVQTAPVGDADDADDDGMDLGWLGLLGLAGLLGLRRKDNHVHHDTMNTTRRP